KADWTIDAQFKDEMALPKFAHGADLTKVPLAKDVPRIDISQHLKAETSNTFLRQQRVSNKLLPAINIADKINASAAIKPLAEAPRAPLPAPPAAGGSGSASVD